MTPLDAGLRHSDTGSLGAAETEIQGETMTIETINGVARYPAGYGGTPTRPPEEDPFLSPTNSALVLIDYQPHILQGVRNVPHEDLLNNTTGLVKSAAHFGLPIVLSHVGVGLKGADPFLQELVEAAPSATLVDRTNVNAWEEAEFVAAVESTGKRKLIMGGLWTDVCLAYPAIEAAQAGFQVHVPEDTVGSINQLAHDNGMKRMIQAGVRPITWNVVLAELQRDHARARRPKPKPPAFSWSTSSRWTRTRAGINERGRGLGDGHRRRRRRRGRQSPRLARDRRPTCSTALGQPHALRSMAAPIALGMLSTFLFQVVDTYFVGRIGPAPLAVLSFSSPIYFLLLAMVMGLGTGVATVVAKAVGEGDEGAARRLSVLSLVLVAGVATLLCLAGYSLIAPTLRWLGAAPDIVALGESYLGILYLGMPLIMVAVVGGAILRAHGETRRPELIMMTAGAVNLILDYLLIFGVGPFPRLGLAGAALATTLSWGFVFVGMATLLWKRRVLGIEGLTRAEIRAGYGHLLSIGSPAVGTQMLAPIIGLFVTFLIAGHGSDAVAAYGVASRVQALALVGIYGVSTAITPFIAQNLGAGRRERVDEAIVFAGKASVYWGLAVCALVVLLAGPIATLFTDSPSVQRITRLYFYIVALSYAPLGIFTVTAAIFNGSLDPTKAFRILLVKAMVLTAPLTYVGSLFGVVGIFAGIALSNVVAAIHAARQMRQHLALTSPELATRSPGRDYASDLRLLVGCR